MDNWYDFKILKFQNFTSAPDSLKSMNLKDSFIIKLLVAKKHFINI